MMQHTNWLNLLYLLGVGLMVWLALRMVKSNPLAFTRENFFKTTYICGLLALILIAGIALAVMYLKRFS